MTDKGPSPVDTAPLEQILQRFDHLLIAFSGGVDSTLLLAEALRVLGRDRVLALTALSPTLPAAEQQEAAQLAEQLGANHLQLPTQEMQRSAFVTNGPDRCYHCKSALFDLCDQVIHQQSEPNRWQVAYGANQDDLGEHRPGMDAARERGIHAPFLELAWGKTTIRARSHELALATANKAPFACLSSRFPTHTPITVDHLAQVEQAEIVLRQAGFRLFRVRFEGAKARVELGQQELSRLADPQLKQQLTQQIEKTGFLHVFFDPQGYRPGGANPSSQK
uniref:NAD/GMP synthase domain-containing protein n=1 Tax=Magnetococcus massalia (strain MO-1) TaxID=451514 RepID=A0A1S7LNP8_MAGMO|nr:conserved protein of unknown function [Candidatus Magnetococcus massalia]